METSIPPMTTNKLVPVCYYITTLGILLKNDNLLSSAAENDTVPVINALFEYLSKSNDESAAKIHLFKKIQSKISTSGYEELNNSQNVNKFYQHIINMGLFAHYGNIAGYVRNIFQNNNESFSNQRIILLHNLFRNFSHNFTVKNICSLRKKSENLNILAIEKIFSEYVLPVFNEMWKHLKSQVNDASGVKRYKRQVSSTKDNDVGMDQDLSEEEESLEIFRFNFLSKLETHGLMILNQERERFCKIMKSLALEQIVDGENHSLDLWFLELTTGAKLGNFFANLKKSTFFFDDFKLLTIYSSGKVPSNILEKDLESDEKLVAYHITSDSLNGFVDVSLYSLNNLYVLYPDIILSVKDVRKEKRKGKSFFIIDIERIDLSLDTWHNIIQTMKCKELFNERHSERMQAIERAAEFISSFIPNSTFTEVANTLKSYVLPVHPENSRIPTYYEVSQRTTYYTTFLQEYSYMKIDNNKYTDDVLYDSKFYFPYDFDQLWEQWKQMFTQISPTIFRHYYDMYRKNLDSLERKIGFEDFLKISYFLNKPNTGILKRNSQVALLRVALRQCDEQLYEVPIVLYQTFYMKNVIRNKFKYTKSRVTLKLKKACSENHALMRRKMLHLQKTKGTGIIFFFKIHLKNPCGVANVYEFNKNEMKSHFLAIAAEYKRIDKIEETIGQHTVIYMTVKSIEEVPKEKTMVKMVKLLNSLNVGKN